MLLYSPAVKTLLLSALTRQFLIQGKRFAELHPNDWLMWEAGTLNVPRGSVADADTVSETLEHTDVRPRVGDPLLFALPVPQEGLTVTIGRAEGNDLVLSDGAVSRHHCTLVFSNGGWMVTSAEEGHAMKVDESAVQFGQWMALSSGQALTLGHLTLRLYTSRGMLLRLAQLFARK
jgi:hypothetical protein